MWILAFSSGPINWHGLSLSLFLFLIFWLHNFNDLSGLRSLKAFRFMLFEALLMDLLSSLSFLYWISRVFHDFYFSWISFCSVHISFWLCCSLSPSSKPSCSGQSNFVTPWAAHMLPHSSPFSWEFIRLKASIDPDVIQLVSILLSPFSSASQPPSTGVFPEESTLQMKCWKSPELQLTVLPVKL